MHSAQVKSCVSVILSIDYYYDVLIQMRSECKSIRWSIIIIVQSICNYTEEEKRKKKKAKNITKIDRLQSNLDNSAINSHGYGLKVGGICLNDDIYSQCNSHIDNSQLQFNLLITEAALFFCVQML